MSKLLVFGFANTIAEDVLKGIKADVKISLPSTQQAITSLVKNILESKPDSVLGLGMYSGRDQEALRIESICKNKFRNQVLGQISSYPINYFVTPADRSKITQGMGNSWCNLVSYLIMEEITKQHVKIRFAYSIFYRQNKGN